MTFGALVNRQLRAAFHIPVETRGWNIVEASARRAIRVPELTLWADDVLDLASALE
jgi:hypothetical protein